MMIKEYEKKIAPEYRHTPDHPSAISPVPGTGPGRKVNKIQEELARLAARQVKAKEDIMATETIRGTIVRDIFEAAYLAAYGVEPTVILKDEKVVFIFPAGERVLRLRLDYKKSYIKTQDLAEQVRRLQAKARLLRK
jgi:hypothetical protein